MNYKKIIFILCLGIFLSSERNVYAQIATVTFNYTGATQSWTVPAGVTSVTVDVRGAQGAGYGGYTGGLGARMTGVLAVSPSTILTVYVGGQGVASENAGGGGGGSGIVSSGTPLVVAGGGGGASDYGNANGLPGLTATYGGNSSGPGGTNGYGGDKGYVSGDCGWAAGGGGFYGDGYGGDGAWDGGPLPGILSGPGAGIGAVNGGTGGTGGGCGFSGLGSGGWGCGGGARGEYGGGGGGGYSGGGGGQYTNSGAGGGGGSYSVAADTVNTSGYQSGDGIVIISYPTFSANQNIISNVSCNGGTNGGAYITLSGGCSAPYTYSWAPGGETTDTVTGLTAGIYSVTVYDSCGTSTSVAVTITQPNVIASSPIVINNVTCNGGNNGSVSANLSGGTSPFTYTWGGGQTTDTISGLTAGTYTVSVSDSCGGTATGTVTITQPNILTAANTTVNSNVSCFGGNNGSASVSLVGGGTPYTYAWTGGSSTNSATGLTAGTYTINVTDACGATASAIATITQPAAAVAISASVTTNVNCHGGNTGSASSVASGGTSPYTYLWTPGGQTNSSASNLTAGTYTVKVTDNNGCTASASVSITQPLLLSVSVSETANVSCNGGSNGSASSIVGGGVYPYTFSWSNGGTMDTATGLSAGSYTLTVTDSHGCTASASVNITQPATPVSVTANTLTNIICYAGNDGSATSAASGGTSPYMYLWTDGETNATISGLTAGDYTVTVTDNNGCTTSAMVTVTQPSNPVTLNASVASNVYCYEGNTGAATTSASGGFIPYTYSWSDGETTAFATGLTAGSYTINVADNHGCTASAMVTITQPATAVSVSATAMTNVLCNGGNGGSISSTTAGGVAPYTYAWSNGETNANIATLTAGTYTVVVTDNNGCSASAMSSITQPSTLNTSATITSNLSCNGSNIGSAISSASGGVAPYTYAWSDGKTTSVVNGLSAGSYTLTINDANGCSQSDTITITQPTAVVASIHTTIDNGHNTGSAWVKVSGGIAPYTYLWSPGGQATDSIKGQAKGVYCCTITDGNGCELEICDTIMSDLGVAAITTGGGNVNVYPNPNNGQFTIQYSVTGENTVVEIYNVLGAEVYTSTFISSKSGNAINISNQPAGIYLYRVISSANGNLLGEGKIVLQK